MEAVTAVGIGILFSTVILWLVGEFRMGQSTGEILGRIVFEAAPVSIGVSFANAQIQGKSRTGEDARSEKSSSGPSGSLPERERLQLRADLKDAGATAAGAAVFALNIAPTEEVIMIATRLPYWQVVVMLFATLILGYVILFASGFEEHQVFVPCVFQHPVAETVVVGAISLAVAACLLFLSQAVQQESRVIPVVVTPRVASSGKTGESYVLPVELRNPSSRTLKDLKVEVSYTPPQGEPETRELDVAYLGEKSTLTLYVYLDHDPRRVSVEVTPQSYRLE